MAMYGREINSLFKAVEVIRTRAANHPAPNNVGEMSAIQIKTLLAIAAHPGITIEELTHTVGMAQPSAFRNVNALSLTNSLTRKPGANYVEGVKDHRETRRFVYFLTPRGKLAVQAALEALSGKPVVDFAGVTFQEWESRGHKR